MTNFVVVYVPACLSQNVADLQQQLAQADELLFSYSHVALNIIAISPSETGEPTADMSEVQLREWTEQHRKQWCVHDDDAQAAPNDSSHGGWGIVLSALLPPSPVGLSAGTPLIETATKGKEAAAAVLTSHIVLTPEGSISSSSRAILAGQFRLAPSDLFQKIHEDTATSDEVGVDSPGLSSIVQSAILDRLRMAVYESGAILWETRLWSSASTLPPSSVTTIPLDTAAPLLMAGNIRVAPFSVELLVEPAAATASSETRRQQRRCLVISRDTIATEGDIVVGLVNRTGQACEVMDHTLTKEAVAHPDAPLRSLWFRKPFVAMAPLGNRESSTHVSGRVPPHGARAVGDNTTVLHWIGGESGLIGELVQDGSRANPLAERSIPFTMYGTLCWHDGDEKESKLTPVNVSDLAVAPLRDSEPTTQRRGEVPIILVAGTSAEAGKSTWTAKIVRHLTERKQLRVAAIKATGTGGVVDCATQRMAGAVATLDQVDAGLPTTYTSPQRVIAHLPRLLSRCAQAPISADVIVCELGGDIMWANNLTVLTQIPEFIQPLAHLFVLCNDSLAALGASVWLDHCVFSFSCSPASGGPLIPWRAKTSLVASPFRNYSGALQRAEALVKLPGFDVPMPMDPNGSDALALLLDKLFDRSEE